MAARSEKELEEAIEILQNMGVEDEDIDAVIDILERTKLFFKGKKEKQREIQLRYYYNNREKENKRRLARYHRTKNNKK